jgi:beta-lactam-binding protein with PASTA domain
MLLSLLGAWPAAAVQVPQPQQPRPWLKAAAAYNIRMTWDFETGDLRGWRPTGHAFDRQPTLGDNPTARQRGQPAQQQGNYWIGTYELYQKGDPDGRPGGIQGDAPQGTLTADFTAATDSVSFLIGGGDSQQTGVELVEVVDDIDLSERRAYFATGENSETMRRVAWDLGPFKGRPMRIRILDLSSQGWGHVNADDFRFYNASPPPDPGVVVPQVTGRDLGGARGQLDSAGLELGHVDSVGSSAQPGVVVDQDPKAGRRVPRGSTVALEIARPAPPVTKVVPDVVGQSLERATAIITDSALHVGRVDTTVADTLGTRVVQQFPPGGSTLPPEGHVDLLLAVLPTARVLVPNVIGDRLPEAKRHLASASLRVGKVTGGKGGNRVVQSQAPRAGDSAVVGSPVALTLVVARRRVAVPDLHGMKLRAAESALAAVGLTRSDVTWVQAAGDSGTVVNQSPAAHDSVVRGSAVQLYLAFPLPEPPNWWRYVIVALGLGALGTVGYLAWQRVQEPTQPPITQVGARPAARSGEPAVDGFVPSATGPELGFRPGLEPGSATVEGWSSIKEWREHG